LTQTVPGTQVIQIPYKKIAKWERTHLEGTVRVERQIRRDRSPHYARDKTGKPTTCSNSGTKIYFHKLTGTHFQFFLGYG
jgi:hypothetical protein